MGIVVVPANGSCTEPELLQDNQKGGLNSNNNELCDEEEWKNLISHLVAPKGLTYLEVIAMDSGLDTRDLSTGMANGGV